MQKTYAPDIQNLEVRDIKALFQELLKIATGAVSSMITLVDPNDPMYAELQTMQARIRAMGGA